MVLIPTPPNSRRTTASVDAFTLGMVVAVWAAILSGFFGAVPAAGMVVLGILTAINRWLGAKDNRMIQTPSEGACRFIRFQLLPACSLIAAGKVSGSTWRRRS